MNQEKSQGHICWVGRMNKEHAIDKKEIFQRGSGIFFAPVSNVIMPDGYRVGRWECSVDMFEKFKDMILKGYDFCQ